MTDNMRARVERALKISNGNLTIEYAKSVIAQKKKELDYWNNLPVWKKGYLTPCSIRMEESDIAYFEAVIEYLTEAAAAKAVAETVRVLADNMTTTTKVKVVRRAVATLANKLHRLNYSLSDAFKRAWTFIRAFRGLVPFLS